jgi:enoyl-CoA hydratase/carnithine racemase
LSYEFILYDTPADGVARITLNRPDQLNAMNLGLIQEVYAAADEAANDDDIAVLVYRGAGRAFCVGRDFKEVAKYEMEHHDGTQSWRKTWHGWGLQTWLYPKATIAQVHGFALGGGEWLSAYCDITIASDDAILGFPEGRWGVASGEFHHWNWILGPKQVKEYILACRNMSAAEAKANGLVNHVVSPDDLEATVMSMAQDIVANERRTPGYVRANKGGINANNLELMKAAINFSPLRQEGGPVQVKLLESAKKFQDEFQRTIAEDGMKAGLALLHGGNTSRM